jgi:hypothetical protein
MGSVKNMEVEEDVQLMIAVMQQMRQESIVSIMVEERDVNASVAPQLKVPLHQEA